VVGKTYVERGAPVVVLARWKGDGPRNVLVERADGSRVVRPFRGLRRAKEAPSGLEPLYGALQAPA
jgi:acetyl esterase